MADPQETIGPYSLEKLLGSGGMGQVYQAYDHRLQRRIAIKHFQNGARTDAASRKRFLHEARAAAALSHPSIVQIYDILDDERGDWIVMELVDGPSVAALVAQGPLPVARAVRVALQVTEGLAEAHDHGILHRDLKSENVMLARGERAKILDFGLAKRLWPGDQTMTLSGEGRVLGTCRAMSPEQARSLELDSRSDLFALGVLLYEMLTGRSPFHADNHTDTLTRVCHLRPPPISDLRADLPPELVELVGHLLEKDRERRPQSAQEVAEVLAVLDSTLSPSGSSSGSVPRPSSSGSGEPPSWAPGWLTESVYLGPPARGMVQRWLPWALAGLALVAVAVGLWSWQLSMEPAVPVRPSVAVLGLKNVSRDPEMDWLGTAAAEALNSSLAAGEDLRTVAGETVARVLRDLDIPEGKTLGPETLGRLRSLIAADHVIVGSYTVLPGNTELELVIYAQDTRTGDFQSPIIRKAIPEQVVDAARDIARDLRQQLGAGVLSQEDLSGIRASLPRTESARRLYSEGLKALRSHDFPVARDRLGLAVAEEPDFPLSHAELARALSALGFDQEAREAAKRAADLAGALPQRERQFVRARDHEMSFRWAAAIEAYRTLWEQYPDEVQYGLSLTQALISNGEPQAALEVVAEMRRLPAPASNDPRIDLMEIEILRGRGRYDELIEVARRVEHQGEQLGARMLTAAALLHRAFGQLRTGLPGEAEKAARKAQRLFREEGSALGEALALNRIGNVYYDSGNCNEALPIFEEFRRRMESMGHLGGLSSALNNVASCSTMHGDLATTAELLKESIELADQIGALEQGWLARVNLADLLLRLGDLKGAQKSLQEGKDRSEQAEYPYAANFGRLVEGDIQLVAGNLEAAREYYQQSFEQNQELGDPRYLSFSHYALGVLERLAGNLSASRERLETSLQLRRGLKDAHFGAQTEVALGITLLEQGFPAQAHTLARQARQAFQSQESPERELEALALEVAASLALGEDENLSELLTRGDKLLVGCESLLTKLWSQIQLARAWRHRGQSSRAQQALEAVIKSAADHGLVPLELEAQLALADLEEAEGRALEGQRRRQNVHDRAKDLGLGLLQQKAGSELPPSRPSLRNAA